MSNPSPRAVVTPRAVGTPRTAEELAARNENLVEWYQGLEKSYGRELLIMLICAQWFLKGLVLGWLYSSIDWVFRDLGVPGPRLQIYKTVTQLPFALKPIIGLTTDTMPIMGYRRNPYIFIVTVIAVCGMVVLGGGKVNAVEATFCFFLIQMQVAVIDLLTEARYTEAMRDDPLRFPDLMTFVWVGIFAGLIISTASSGFIIDAYGPYAVAYFMILPGVLVLYPTARNYMNDKCMTSAEISALREQIFAQKEILWLVIITSVGALILACVVFFGSLTILQNYYVALVVLAVVSASFYLLCRPEIGGVNVFFLLQGACLLSIEGAMFYFFTDTEEQYPEGPHFSALFYASVTGVVGAISGFVGMLLYNKYLKWWRYHPLLVVLNSLLVVANLINIMVFTRYNLVLGIPDALFVLGSTMFHWVLYMLLYMPAVVLTSQFCPKGLEATMFALIAGAWNLGWAVGQYGGSALLYLLGVQPRGAPNESAQFKNLWLAALIAALVPIISTTAAFFLLPNATQTETLLPDGEVRPYTCLSGLRRAKKPTNAQDGEFADLPTAGGHGEGARFGVHVQHGTVVSVWTTRPGRLYAAGDELTISREHLLTAEGKPSNSDLVMTLNEIDILQGGAEQACCGSPWRRMTSVVEDAEDDEKSYGTMAKA
mmetsp:Transcript_99774/g.228994  ORF Transcript_99774/g.228994 Transcript_99774/m.228994 type:complete len:656 (+) Transcript_99774:178-2145(+)